ncbi:MAG: histidine phosphatase family protein [Actinobacteria bacterium]|nr:histidine phosphatase family protein [Actinomycetota bacterium]
MTALVLVQHGEKERIPGDPGLTPRGREQARRTATTLAELGDPEAVYSSPLRRAAETGSIIADHLDVAMHYDDRLRERLNWDGDEEQSMESFLADWERTTRDRDFVPARGDSSSQAARRMFEAIGDVANRHPAMAVVVTHGGATVDFLRTLLGDDALAALAPSLLAAGVPPCALTTVIVSGSTWRVDRIASEAHLTGG